eukprot:jgi/Hompol1/231/HPOL_004137-RA
MTTSKTVELGAFGVPNIKVVERPRPVPGAGEVLVNIKLRPVHPVDIMAISGHYPGYAPKSFPAIPGYEGYGVIAETGAGVTAVKAGQRVIPLPNFADGHGTWQEYLVLSQHSVIPVPDNVPDASAAQLIVNPLTVVGLIRVSAVPQGEFLLQDSAGSTVGRMVIQTVNVVRRTAQIAELKALGADIVVSTEGLDTADKIAEAILAATGGKRPHSAITAVGGITTASLTAAVRDRGLVQVYGLMEGLYGQVHLASLLGRNVVFKGFNLNEYLAPFTDSQRKEAFSEVFDLMGKGILVPNSGEVVPLEKVLEAIGKNGQTARGGKILLSSP